MKTNKIRLIAFLSLTVVMVFAMTALAADWEVPGDFATIQAAVNSASVVDGDRILVGPGSFAGATVTKDVEIKGIGGAVINVGGAEFPQGDVGFLISAIGSGAVISHWYFDEAIAFPVVGLFADDVTVNHNTMINPIQGITVLAGSRWEVHHNEIIDLRTINGGGIGIYVLYDSRFGSSIIEDNTISHNKIHGTLHVSTNDVGGYNGVGVAFQARGAGGTIRFNRIVKNNVGLTSDTPGTVDVTGIELSEVPTSGAIFDNNVGFNDLRDVVGAIGQIQLIPASLDNPTNRISRNMGNNRGHGLHPCGFTGQTTDPNECQ